MGIFFRKLDKRKGYMLRMQYTSLFKMALLRRPLLTALAKIKLIRYFKYELTDNIFASQMKSEKLYGIGMGGGNCFRFPIKLFSNMK